MFLFAVFPVPVVLSRGTTPPTLISTNSMLTSSSNPDMENGDEEGVEKGDEWKTTNMSGPLEMTLGTFPPRHRRIKLGGSSIPVQ